MQADRAAVLAVVGAEPMSIGDIGLAVLRHAGEQVEDSAGELAGGDEAPVGVGQRLAAAGLSLSALQRLVDQLVAEQVVQEVRGRELWDRGLPTAGTKATGRYYLAAAP